MKTVRIVLLGGALLLAGGMSAGAGQVADESLAEFVSPATGIELVKVPGGCYVMGDDGGYDYEKPEHEVCVGDFYIGRYEVTQAQYQKLMGHNPSKYKDSRRPVERISWNDAMAFIQKLNETENTQAYRLPTEAEWERAARAGTRTRYYWGDEMDNAYVWYYGSAEFQTHPVGTRKPNAFGLHDMLGNVWEWVSDWYGHGYYHHSPRDNPRGPDSGRFKTRRGGAVTNLVTYVRSATRYRGLPDHRHYILGFRLARSPE
ncbi:formylglycine-generating enzyme family protein [Nitrospina watsonii]|uniref:FGE-sulfatase domain-containing protein n=1 Tax=Nitrospina watsonii TaxID=1323948 RepID=A0ABM9HF08_9BACT|nr:SUMF1/EgtB/PvdO family nonheme iron enzyme [Nitrospina watsonii]CAI2718622.1 FGE-sulfatase domain-containing protein [Nitrospina watsonii]